MDKIRIRQNFENYERVKAAFKDFIHALIWESVEVDNGCSEKEIDEHIDKYCRNNDSRMIMAANKDVTDFIKSLESRYEVHCYEINDNGDVIEETVKHFGTDNLKLALSKAASFYRTAKCPQVNILDNNTGQYIAEWD